jgi:hypothetical protein
MIKKMSTKFVCVECLTENKDEIFCPRCLNWCKNCVVKYPAEDKVLKYCKCGEFMGCEYCLTGRWNGLYQQCDICRRKEAMQHRSQPKLHLLGSSNLF